MDRSPLYTERQKFRQWWLWTMLLGANALCLYGVFRQVIGKHPFGEKPASDSALITVAVGVILFTILFASFGLDTMIQKDGIYIRFFPFHLSFRHYAWDQLSKSYIREYSPITEYGGWGFRVGVFGNGKAYSVSGKMGLQLEFTNGRKLLIGTNKADELEMTLKKIGQIKE
jgi:hypothetical protein